MAETYQNLPADVTTMTATVGHFSRQGDNVTLKYLARPEQAEKAWQAIEHNAFYLLGEIPAEQGETPTPIAKYFNRDQSSISRHEVYAEVNLVFTAEREEKQQGAIVEREAGDSDYNVASNRLEQPLEMHPDFRKIHRYNLWQLVAESASATVPAWSDTATTDAEASAAGDYRWSDSAPTSNKTGYVWKLAKARTKSFDVYITSQRVLTVSTYYTSREAACAAIIETGTKAAPAIVPPQDPTGRDYWLVTNCYVTKVGRLWALNIEYTLAKDKWDSIYYD